MGCGAHGSASLPTLLATTTADAPALCTTLAGQDGSADVVGKDIDDICVICIESLVDGEAERVLPCSSMHRFHSQCIQVWLTKSLRCPICARTFRVPRDKRKTRQLAGERVVRAIRASSDVASAGHGAGGGAADVGPPTRGGAGELESGDLSGRGAALARFGGHGLPQPDQLTLLGLRRALPPLSAGGFGVQRPVAS
jgi:Ring finger domain